MRKDLRPKCWVAKERPSLQTRKRFQCVVMRLNKQTNKKAWDYSQAWREAEASEELTLADAAVFEETEEAKVEESGSVGSTAAHHTASHRSVNRTTEAVTFMAAQDIDLLGTSKSCGGSDMRRKV